MGNHRADRRGHRRATPLTPQVTAPVSAPVGPGRRKASKHTGLRGPLFRGLPSIPVLLGVAALSVSAGGAVTMSQPDFAATSETRLTAASALGGDSGQSSSDLLEGRSPVSRDSSRDDLADAADADLVAEAEAMTQRRNAALAKFAQLAEAQSKKLSLIHI